MGNSSNHLEKTVLVVDDDNEMNLLLTLALEANGINVIAVSSAEEALNCLSTAPVPNLIFTDMNMPGMGGLICW